MIQNQSVLRVQNYLKEHGYPVKVQEMSASTRTAKDAANAIGCDVAQIAKSLVFCDVESKATVLVITSGTNRVCLKKLDERLNLSLKQASPKLVKHVTGYTIGGVPPVAHLKPSQTLIDEDLKQYSILWAAAGSPFSVFSLTPNALAKLTRGAWADVAE